MTTINLEKYAPIISDKDVGNSIYMTIKNTLTKGGPVIIDLNGIKSMATFCAKQIFGRLYLDVGSSNFFDKIQIKNASDDVKAIIRIGIQDAIEEKV